MKAKRFLSIIVLVACLFVSASAAYAYDLDNPKHLGYEQKNPVGGSDSPPPVGGTTSNPTGIKIVNPLVGGDMTIDEIVEKIINFLLLIGGPIAALMYVYAGFQFLSAAGDAKKINAAKQTIIWTSIGVAVLILSFGIVQIVKDLLSV